MSVVLVTFNSAPDVAQTAASIAAQLQVGDELILIDNGSSDETIKLVLQNAPGTHVVSQANVGFASGCNAGAQIAHGDLLLFLNPDALLQPGALDLLRAHAQLEPSWDAWQPLVTLADPSLVNTAGGEMHFTGLAWSGRCGQPVSAVPTEPYTVAFASGAALVVRRAAWTGVGGMCDRFFMYVEDVDLSLRLWLSGAKVGVVPAARVRHHYDFEKGSYKWHLLERNRWLTVLSTYPTALLVLVMPAMLLTELALYAVALRGGWLRQKLRAQFDVLRCTGWTLRRRREIAATRTLPTAEFARLLGPGLDSPYLTLPSGIGGLVAAGLHAYWRVCLLVIGHVDAPVSDNQRR